MRIEIAGEAGVIIYFGDEISEAVAAKVAAAFQLLSNGSNPAIIDLIPSYTTLLVIYDPAQTCALDCIQWLQRVLSTLRDQAAQPSEVARLEIPVYYAEEVGPDLHEVAKQTGLSVEEVIRLHTEVDYRVYAIGFAPGFAYLGLTDARLRVARKLTPRLKVPKGSVALADNQTAVYPSVSPGGWQLIGRTPIELIDWSAAQVSPFVMGAVVNFRAINREEYLELGGSLDGL